MYFWDVERALLVNELDYFAVVPFGTNPAIFPEWGPPPLRSWVSPQLFSFDSLFFVSFVKVTMLNCVNKFRIVFRLARGRARPPHLTATSSI